MNMTLSMPGCGDRFADLAAPRHGEHALGKCRFIIRRASTSGVYLGLTTTVLPIRSDGAICQTEIIMGQFHGPIAPTTPSAS